ncbi:MAG: class I SAM-dependent methyltransferase, partial [Steroidobacteraceae bacterium]
MNNQRVLYTQSDFPIFQNRMYDSVEAARNCPRGDLRLVQDIQTGLVFNSAFRPELLTYDAAYQNEQAHSAAFRSHLEEVAHVVTQNLGTEKLVEVGCGKAFFLELLQSRGCDITGFDPTYEGSNPAVQRHLFGSGVSVHAKGIVLRHVLEHIQDPVGFLRGLREANGGGLIYIEVPCLEWIIRRRAWFDIFYEHVNYFRLADFHRLFERVVTAGHLFGGQYLFVVADLGSLRTPVAATAEQVVFPPDFLRAAQVEPDNRTVGETVWGAASKGVIYSLLRERAGTPVKTLIDINPAKCGRFVPGTGL